MDLLLLFPFALIAIATIMLVATGTQITEPDNKYSDYEIWEGLHLNHHQRLVETHEKELEELMKETEEDLRRLRNDAA
jgi:hypothetical protein